MSEKSRHKHRDGTIRARWWDYTWPASYFITICTLNRVHHFGQIKNGFMCLSQHGEIAYRCWEQIPLHFPFVTLGQFVIMPDHMHGIVHILDDDLGPFHVDPFHVGALPDDTDPFHDVGALHATRLHHETRLRKRMSLISPKHKSLGSIIRSYKSAVSKEIHVFDPGFKWQPRYYDHIIRDRKSLDAIGKYIQDNPMLWKEE